MAQGRYVLTVVKYNNTRECFLFNSRKQAYVFVNNNMFMNNRYCKCNLVDMTTGECWLNICWRGRDNYKRKAR